MPRALISSAAARLSPNCCRPSDASGSAAGCLHHADLAQRLARIAESEEPARLYVGDHRRPEDIAYHVAESRLVGYQDFARRISFRRAAERKYFSSGRHEFVEHARSAIMLHAEVQEGVLGFEAQRLPQRNLAQQPPGIGLTV